MRSFREPALRLTCFSQPGALTIAFNDAAERIRPEALLQSPQVAAPGKWPRAEEEQAGYFVIST